MKSVLISIQPKWCELIASGNKTIEVRKTRPKIATPFKCYIYCTRNARDLDKLWVLNEQRRQEYGGLTAVCANLAERPDYHYCGNGKVIGEFVCDRIDEAHWEHITGYAGWNIGWIGNCCLSNEDLMTYAGNKDIIYGWHISDLKIYDEPKEVGEFSNNSSRLEFNKTKDGFPWKWSGMSKSPQSWCYVEELS